MPDISKKTLGIIVAVLLSLPAHGREKPRCFTVHGRLYMANGTPSARLWIAGTKRVLGAQPPEQLPAKLRSYLQFGTNIYADFVVCPSEPDRPGWMRSVEIRDAKHLVIEKFVEGQEAPVVFRVK